MFGLVNLITWLFSNKKTEVLATFDQGDYYKTVKRLRAAGVKYRVAINSEQSPGGNWGNPMTEYQIYVKKDDKDAAAAAIN